MKGSNYNRFCLVTVSFLILLLSRSSFGNELPYLKNVEITAKVNLDPEMARYTYYYTVINSLSSIGNLVGLEIHVTYPKGGGVLRSDGLTIPRGKTMFTFEQTISRLDNLKEVNIVPIGMQKPAGWMTGLSVYGTARLGGGDYVYLKPGQSLSGFILYSYGLPGIRDFKADPSFDVNEYYPSVDSLTSQEEVDALLAGIEQDESSVSFKGKTIGPTAPPADFKPIIFLDYIVSLKKQSYNLGWLIQCEDDGKGKEEGEEEGIMKSLDKKLANAREKLVKGDIEEVVEMLNSFIHEVEALYKGDKEEKKEKSDKHDADKEHGHITSEAYALLKYNTQYLVGKLGGAGKEEKEKEK
ncbi:MAG: hypothetical protein M0Z71_05345 [Nitrospiraceae bacterium]|nr:hypothetical protein [Nitrospiraceae bacterium]